MRILFSFLILFFAQDLMAQEELLCKEHFVIADYEREQHTQRATFRSNPLTQNYDLKYHRLEWEVDPAVNYIKGSVTSYFVPTEANFQQLNFDLAQEMSINAIIYHGNNLSSYTQTSDDNLQIDLPAPLMMGELDSITISYEGEPPSDGFGSFETSTHNGIPVMWTLSEPYGAKDWWPCKQDLNDKIDSIDVMVTTPSAYRVASNGLLVQEQVVGDDKLYHWKHRYPIPAYLIAIAVTNYAVFSDFVHLNNGDSIEVLNYVYPEDLDAAINNLVNTVRIMEFFNDFFGDYPFAREKYGHAQFGWGGGMEHQTMSFMGGFNYGLQAHELAHQWFGNKITCGSWEDIWLNEGFATYLTGISYEFILVGEIWWGEWKKTVINRVTSQPGGSVFVTDTTDVGRIFSSRLSYSKGSYLLHMLRWKLGDDDFFQALRNYLNDPQLAFSYAKTNDLKVHLEQQSGEDLTQYFQDWFYGEGFPSYQLQAERTSSGINLTVNQTTSHPSVDFYAMPIPVQLKGEGQDTIVRLDHTFSGQVFNIDLPFQVDSIEFDPDLWILSANNTVEFMTTNTQEVDPLEQAIQLSPNPFREELQLQISEDGPTVDQVKIYNAQGQLIRAWSGGVAGSKIIDTSNWPSGMYLVSFYAENGLISRKVVKN